MSQEEHGALSRLTAAVEVLAAGHDRTEKLLGKFIEATDRRFDETDKRFEGLSERDRFSWAKMFSFVGSGLVIAAAVTALLSLRIDSALAPISTQNQISIRDRAELRDRVAVHEAAIAAEKEGRQRSEKESDQRAAVQTERTNELYYAAHGHYPATPQP